MALGRIALQPNARLTACSVARRPHGARHERVAAAAAHTCWRVSARSLREWRVDVDVVRGMRVAVALGIVDGDDRAAIRVDLHRCRYALPR